MGDTLRGNALERAIDDSMQKAIVFASTSAGVRSEFLAAALQEHLLGNKITINGGHPDLYRNIYAFVESAVDLIQQAPDPFGGAQQFLDANDIVAEQLAGNIMTRFLDWLGSHSVKELQLGPLAAELRLQQHTDIGARPLLCRLETNPYKVTSFSKQGHFFIPGENVDFSTMSSAVELNTWALHQGGIQAGLAHYRLYLQNRSKLDVLLDGLQVFSRSEPVSTIGYQVSKGTAGYAEPWVCRIDLDRQSEVTTMQRRAEESVPFQLILKPGELETIDLEVMTETDGVAWHVEVSSNSGGRSWREPVGIPFGLRTVRWRASKPIYQWFACWYYFDEGGYQGGVTPNDIVAHSFLEL